MDLCRKAGEDVSSHTSFLRKLARRRARDSRLKLFTTNYDLCFEKAAGSLGLVPIDGFSFTNPRRFDPRYFNYDLVNRSSTHDVSFIPGVFQYFKLHGSVDWENQQNHDVFVNPKVASDDACLIYPARTKYQRSYQQPHLELMAHFLAALRQPNTCVLAIGFGFNDDHLTAPLLSALNSNPHFRMIVATLDAQKRLAEDEPKRPWQELKSLANSTDLSFISTTFDTLVKLIPDLQALTPAERLVRAVQGIAGKS